MSTPPVTSVSVPIPPRPSPRTAAASASSGRALASPGSRSPLPDPLVPGRDLPAAGVAASHSTPASTSRTIWPSPRPPRPVTRTCPVVCSRTGKRSRAEASRTEAATSTAASNPASPAAPDGYAYARVSSRTVVTGSLGSTYRRTSRVPARALERQCTCRRSSPGTYSRSAWKVTPPSVRLSTDSPSGLLDRADTSGVSEYTTGWTRTTAGSPTCWERDSKPNRSALPTCTGPTRSTPRRAVGNGSAIVRRVDPRRERRCVSVASSPCGTRTRRAPLDRSARFLIVTLATAASPRRTRPGTTSISAPNRGR